jgi:hypothetical protein
MLLVSAAIGPATPIAIAMLPDISHMAQPIPDPAIALKTTAIASERIDDLSIGFCSMMFFQE